MIIQIRADVYCTDGICGRLSRLVVDRASRKLTHLVVHEPAFTGVDRIVPSEYLAGSESKAVWLSLNKAQFAGKPTFTYLASQALLEGEGRPHYSDPQYGFAEGTHWDFAQPTPEGTAPAPSEHAQNVDVAAPKDEITRGELGVDEHIRVNSLDGSLGTLQEVVIDPGTKVVTHIVMRESQLLGHRDVRIAVGNIDKVRNGTIYLALSTEQVHALPKVKS